MLFYFLHKLALCAFENVLKRTKDPTRLQTTNWMQVTGNRCWQWKKVFFSAHVLQSCSKSSSDVLNHLSSFWLTSKPGWLILWSNFKLSHLSWNTFWELNRRVLDDCQTWTSKQNVENSISQQIIILWWRPSSHQEHHHMLCIWLSSSYSSNCITSLVLKQSVRLIHSHSSLCSFISSLEFS